MQIWPNLLFFLVLVVNLSTSEIWDTNLATIVLNVFFGHICVVAQVGMIHMKT